MAPTKLNQVPVLHIRGTNYTVGFAIGRTFLNLIQDFLNRWSYFKDTLLPTYDTLKGREIYETSLALCTKRFPLYVQEIKGIADGAEIPFHQIFLLHIESYMTRVESEGKREDAVQEENEGLKACTDILCNNDDIGLAHTEDALPEMAHNFFIVDAHILDEQGNTLEHWASLTYPGYLSGYTMGYNRNGIVHSINTVLPAKTFADRTPVYLITRALLGAKNKEDLLEILKDTGTGIGDSFNLNVIFTKEQATPTVYNIEVGANQDGGSESAIDVLNIENGQSFAHCNKYLRLNVPEVGGKSWKSSLRRHATINNCGVPQTLEGIKNILSDRTIFRTPGVLWDGVPEYAATICVGVFDIKNKTWSIYTGLPNASPPVVVLPMHFQF